MTFTYDLATDVGKVRFLLSDSNGVTPKFTDEEIGAALELYSGSLNLAAAACCDSLAVRLTMDPDNGRQIGDTKTDLTAATDALREMAARFRTVEEELPAFAIAEENLSTFNELEIIRNYIMRTEGGL